MIILLHFAMMNDIDQNVTTLISKNFTQQIITQYHQEMHNFAIYYH